MRMSLTSTIVLSALLFAACSISVNGRPLTGWPAAEQPQMSPDEARLVSQLLAKEPKTNRCAYWKRTLVELPRSSIEATAWVEQHSAAICGSPEVTAQAPRTAVPPAVCTGFEWLTNVKPPGDPSDTPARHEAGCRKGNDDDCHAIAVILDRQRKGIGSELGVFRAACDAKSVEGCRLLGKEYLHGEAVAKDEARASALLAKACEEANAQACVDLAFTFTLGQGVKKDDEQAFSLMQKACDRGALYACFNLGVWYVDGSHGRKDPAKGIAIYEKNCDAGDGSRAATSVRCTSTEVESRKIAPGPRSLARRRAWRAS